MDWEWAEKYLMLTEYTFKDKEFNYLKIKLDLNMIFLQNREKRYP